MQVSTHRSSLSQRQLLTHFASTSNGQFVKDCGADIILLYDAGPNFDFADALNGRPIDAVIDCVGGDHYFHSACRCAYPLGAHKGRFVTTVCPDSDPANISYAPVAFKLMARCVLRSNELNLLSLKLFFRSVAQLWQPSYSFVRGYPNLYALIFRRLAQFRYFTLFLSALKICPQMLP
jgi:hypothetical protein